MTTPSNDTPFNFIPSSVRAPGVPPKIAVPIIRRSVMAQEEFRQSRIREIERAQAIIGAPRGRFTAHMVNTAWLCVESAVSSGFVDAQNIIIDQLALRRAWKDAKTRYENASKGERLKRLDELKTISARLLRMGL